MGGTENEGRWRKMWPKLRLPKLVCCCLLSEHTRKDSAWWVGVGVGKCNSCYFPATGTHGHKEIEVPFDVNREGRRK